MIELIEGGVVTNRRKRLNPGKTVFTFAMGQKAMYDFLDDNPSVESHPVDYVNDPYIISQNDNVISINAALQIDLTGAVNAEHMLGHQYSATGATRLRAGCLCLPRRQVDHRLPLYRSQRQGVAHRPPPGWSSDHAAHRHAHRCHGIRLDQPQGEVIDGARQGVNRPGAPRVPRRAHGGGQGTPSDLRPRVRGPSHDPSPNVTQERTNP
ncbi:acetyl-CoA hydrolase/transferase C-terminal domain-containing protein [Tunturiibacter gelidiferens]|uniref:acetyl-CoA hydrolase/transferase C-terminal domain-containing protein n=1 Tax=Tunturiibacter gelidiferens TaxID=3069689 RepID=UPI003D9BC60B